MSFSHSFAGFSSAHAQQHDERLPGCLTLLSIFQIAAAVSSARYPYWRRARERRYFPRGQSRLGMLSHDRLHSRFFLSLSALTFCWQVGQQESKGDRFNTQYKHLTIKEA